MHVYEVRPRKDYRGVDLISDVLLFGRLWYYWGSNCIYLLLTFSEYVVSHRVPFLRLMHQPDPQFS